MKKLSIIFIAVLLLSTFSAPVHEKVNAADESTIGNSINKAVSVGEQADKIKEVFGEKLYPNKPITRSEFVYYLHKSLNIQIAYFKAPEIKDYFSDINNEQKYTSAVIDLITAGILDFKGKFEPQRILTREEMAHFILKAYEYKTGEKVLDSCSSVELFKDRDKMNKAYISDILKAQNLKLLKGRGSNLFFPKDNCTRAEAITAVNNLITIINKQNEPLKVLPGYERGKDGMAINETIKNISKSDVKINYSNGQKYDFIILDENRKEIYRWSAGRMFTQMISEFVLKPGENVVFTEVLKYPENKDILEKAAYLKTYVIESGKLTNPDGYEIKIQKK